MQKMPRTGEPKQAWRGGRGFAGQRWRAGQWAVPQLGHIQFSVPENLSVGGKMKNQERALRRKRRRDW